MNKNEHNMKINMANYDNIAPKLSELYIKLYVF